MGEKEHSDVRKGEEAQGQDCIWGANSKEEEERDQVWGLEKRGKWEGCGKMRFASSFALCHASSSLISYSASLFMKTNVDH